MIRGQWKLWMQQLAARAGYQIRRLEPGVDLLNAQTELQRLLDGEITSIIEVGAADGRDSLELAQRYPSAIVRAFEPLPASFAKLQLKAALDSRVKPYPLALADQAGKATLFVGNWDDASSLHAPLVTGSTFDAYQAASGTIEVDVTTLDAICDAESITHVDLLKLDAQGAELRIVEGARNLLGSGRVRVIYTEIQFLRSYRDAGRFDDLWGRLASLGYRLHNIYDIKHNQWGEICWGDAIFLREGSTA